MSPCSLCKDFCAVTSLLLQWNPRQRVRADEPGGLSPRGLHSSGWHRGDKDRCGMRWARTAVGLSPGIAITAKWGTRMERRNCAQQKEGKPCLRFFLARSSPGVCIEHFWSPVATCRQPPPPPRGLSCSTAKRLKNQRLIVLTLVSPQLSLLCSSYGAILWKTVFFLHKSWISPENTGKISMRQENVLFLCVCSVIARFSPDFPLVFPRMPLKKEQGRWHVVSGHAWHRSSEWIKSNPWQHCDKCLAHLVSFSTTSELV